MFCPGCGANIEENTNICKNCGKDLQIETFSTETEERESSPFQEMTDRLNNNSGILKASGVIAIIFGLLGILSSFSLFSLYIGQPEVMRSVVLNLVLQLLTVIFGIIVVSKSFIRNIETKKPQLILLIMGVLVPLDLALKVVSGKLSPEEVIPLSLFSVLLILIYILLINGKKIFEKIIRIVLIFTILFRIIFAIINLVLYPNLGLFLSAIFAIVLTYSWYIVLFVAATKKKQKSPAPVYYSSAGENTDYVYSKVDITDNGAQILDRSAHIDMVLHILLTLFTFGIWALIWIYRTTKSLNKTPNAAINDPGTTLLLCMFVPFYTLYWIYKQSQKIEILVKMKNPAHENFSSLYLILGIFLFPVALILMQDKINKVVTGEVGQINPVTTPVQPQQPVYQPSVENTSYIEELKGLKELLDSGIITQEEFDERKEQILGARKN